MSNYSPNVRTSRTLDAVRKVHKSPSTHVFQQPVQFTFIKCLKHVVKPRITIPIPAILVVNHPWLQAEEHAANGDTRRPCGRWG
jgi:hypothetical protein